MRAAVTTLFLLSIAVLRSEQYCAPECAGSDPGTFVRDPTDCTRYYVCLNINGEMIPSEEPIECPDNEYFNDEYTLPRCDPISNAKPGFCSNLCDPCKADCTSDNPGTVQPHELDCSLYYVCLSGGHTLIESCPSNGPFFDFRTGSCQTDPSLCYHYCDICVPHCTQDGQQVADPLDCTKFYYCTPPTTSHFTCPGTGIFNPETSQCEENAPCLEPCNNVTSLSIGKLDV